MYLVLIRHGQSIWNKENRFTGWTDVGLTEEGINEAVSSALKLKEQEIIFDKAYTSVLKRAIDTLDIIKEKLNQEFDIIKDWHLNERHYGALQGLNKDETKLKYGEEQVHLWRRGFDTKPPQLTKEDERYPGNDLKYQDIKEDLLPLGESLKDTMDRTIPYYLNTIKKDLEQNKNVLVVAHGNSLRSIIKYLEKISDEDIMNIEIPTGKPYVYELDEEQNIINKYYL